MHTLIKHRSAEWLKPNFSLLGGCRVISIDSPESDGVSLTTQLMKVDINRCMFGAAHIFLQHQVRLLQHPYRYRLRWKVALNSWFVLCEFFN